MSAMNTAITGMQGSQKWLDVISNNVTNSQTVAYKAGRLSFADIISQGLRNASGPSSAANLGGVNPSQVGLGVTVGTIQTLMTQGSIQVTGNSQDVAISGDGFLTVTKGSDTLYTRAGNLSFDSNGNLTTADGGKVQGWQIRQFVVPGTAPMAIVGPQLDINGSPTDIVIPNNYVLPPRATSYLTALNPAIKDAGVVLKGNLDSAAPLNPDAAAPWGTAAAVPDHTTTVTVYDSLGDPHEILISFWKASDPSVLPPGAAVQTWTIALNYVTNGVTPNNGAYTDDTFANVQAGNLIGTFDAEFNPDGSLAQTLNEAGGVIAPAAAGDNKTIRMTLAGGGVTPFEWALNVGTDLNRDPNGTGLRDGLTSDFGNGFFDTLGNYTSRSTAYTHFSDGYSEGTLLGLSFNQVGGIDGSFSNGQTLEIAKLAMTTFTNRDGLARVGGNYFARTANSGQGRVGIGGANGFGTTVGGALEASNVDLTVELTNMILAQRMFESNSRVVTSADRVLDALVNLGR